MDFLFEFSSSSSSSDDDNQSVSVDETVDILISQIPRLINPPRRTGRRRYIDRNRENGHENLYNDYFSPNPTYPLNLFRRRFRMQRHVFLHLVQAAESYNAFFNPGRDATGRAPISSIQKCTAALRMLAYGEGADRTDEYCRLGQSTAYVALELFTEAVISEFGAQYLRSPNANDLQRLLQVGANRGFPGMMGSIDCMHWEWKNCLSGWRGMYQGRSGRATIVLEAVASQDLWIWHSFSGVPGSCNDLTVLYRSPIFDDLMNGRAPRVNYMVNGNSYDTGYYLTDGIYPQWKTFMPSILLPQTPKDRLFAERQEAARKDVERTYGVLRGRFGVLRRPALTWSNELMSKILTCCIILHNMIVEDERDTFTNYSDPTQFDDEEGQVTVDEPEYEVGYTAPINTYIQNKSRIRNSRAHQDLRSDLIENIWQMFGDDN